MEEIILNITKRQLFEIQRLMVVALLQNDKTELNVCGNKEIKLQDKISKLTKDIEIKQLTRQATKYLINRENNKNR